MNVLDSFRLTGRVALVTGAGSGIGRAYAQALGEAGAAVACVDIVQERAEAVATELRDAGSRAIAVVADVSDEGQVAAMVDACVAGLGGLDAAFANAGIVVADRAFPDTSIQDWRRSIDVNLTGVWLTARAAARALIGGGHGGSLVLTASVYGLVGSFEPSSGSYQAAKGGVVNLTRDLAALMAPHGIRVNAVAPGFVRTGLGSARLLHAAEDEATRLLEDEVIRRTPLGRVGVPGDLKGVSVFLASDASSYVTGAIVPVDGGWLTL